MKLISHVWLAGTRNLAPLICTIGNPVKSLNFYIVCNKSWNMTLKISQKEKKSLEHPFIDLCFMLWLGKPTLPFALWIKLYWSTVIPKAFRSHFNMFLHCNNSGRIEWMFRKVMGYRSVAFNIWPGILIHTCSLQAASTEEEEAGKVQQFALLKTAWPT